MKLADKPVYAVVGDSISQNYLQEGLTYKQWLVGMLASNPMVQQIVYSDTPLISKSWDVTKTAKAIIQQADAIISELEK